MGKNTKIIFTDGTPPVIIKDDAGVNNYLEVYTEQNPNEPIDHWCPTSEAPTHKLTEDNEGDVYVSVI